MRLSGWSRVFVYSETARVEEMTNNICWEGNVCAQYILPEALVYAEWAPTTAKFSLLFLFCCIRRVSRRL